jgi:hypothetical protein
MEIIVIGPEKSCIRCRTTYSRAVAIAEQLPGAGVHPRKSYVHSPDIERYGKVECGHEIESVGNVHPDFDHMKRISAEVDPLEAEADKNAAEIDRLLLELDEVMSPVRRRAEELGYLMTPVVVVNDKVKSAGYVPSLEELREWVVSELAGC